MTGQGGTSMQITLTGRRMDVNDALRAYVDEKIGRVSKIVDQEPMTADVVLSVEKNPSIEKSQVAEVTVHLKGRVVRAEERSTDMFAAIDLASEKLESQVRKYKTKVLDRHNNKVRLKTAPGDSELPQPEPYVEEEEHEPTIVRTKVLAMKPMTEDEAILQLELLGHDFFVFEHADEGAINVLYRRADGDYGIIKTHG
jgi:putative sigma-54 modulation protein